ncbi:hypothetical protein A2U01_0076793, partial [Trifolium medium]|nr:hypothetical protein [Trifolium medium]
FREVKDVWDLSQSMKDVWLGSFKLRINKSRFDRKEDERKTKEVGRSKAQDDGNNNSQSGRSFRTVLVQQSSKQEVVEKDKEVLEEVFSLDYLK